MESNSLQGAAYVFLRPSGGWTDSSKALEITSLDGAANDAFGLSVAARR